MPSPNGSCDAILFSESRKSASPVADPQYKPFPFDDEPRRATPAARSAPYLEGLNPEQLEAVQSLDGPVLVLAGAGTGKTRVLTTRIAHLLATGKARPSNILSVTFTNKAAREMKERVGHMVGDIVEGMPWMGTFHSIGAKILRRHAELVGLNPSFTILDTDDQIRLIKQLLQAENIDEKRWPARLFAGYLDGWKNRGLGPEQVPAGEAASFANGKGKELYVQYQQRLKVLNAVDFGDLLMENIRLFQNNAEVLAQYQHRFRYMLVDEYQDTNVAQYLWLRLLAQESKNICCVGDDDQSIYGWRGADVDNILRFEQDFPGAKVIRLERNYRSTANILGAASHLIANNKSRLGKTLRTEDEPGEKIKVIETWDSGEEARQIGEEIEQLQRKQHKLSDIAILVRASFQMRELEERFVTLGLPYRVIGGPRFYERQEIRDALAYFRVIVSPADGLAFERIVNVPKRGLGDTTMQMLHDYARQNEVPLMEAARVLSSTDDMKPKPRGALRDLILSFDRWSKQLPAMPHTELARIVLDESGYTEMWKNDKSAQAAGRLENLKELVRSMEQFENMQGFLEHVSLVMDTIEGGDVDAVNLMTLHSAKGLEFDTVFLPGWEEGIIPHQRSLDESGRAGLEEERRLAHVGITRAKQRALISFASRRLTHGMWNTNLPSRFLEEIPEEFIEKIEGEGSYAAQIQSRFDRAEPFTSGYSTPGWQRAQARKGSGFSERGSSRGGPLTIEGEILARSSGPSAEFEIGDRVFHDKFGYGEIMEVEGTKVTVEFDKAGEKKLVASFLKKA
ncbi:MAG: UvrD-helicase domain-containing protein [Xanthobacteraceae bacterium]|nr:UvrD-helicase domain-containing protein [Xanthobacteraceae bacterium]